MCNNLSSILCAFKKEKPPSGIDILNRVALIDWDKISSDELDDCCEVIIRTTSEVISLKYEDDITRFGKYKSVLFDIKISIEQSKITDRSVHIKKYFEKFCTYLDSM
jgi:hypothetical protein